MVQLLYLFLIQVNVLFQDPGKSPNRFFAKTDKFLTFSAGRLFGNGQILGGFESAVVRQIRTKSGSAHLSCSVVRTYYAFLAWWIRAYVRTWHGVYILALLVHSSSRHPDFLALVCIYFVGKSNNFPLRDITILNKIDLKTCDNIRVTTPTDGATAIATTTSSEK